MMNPFSLHADNLLIKLFNQLNHPLLVLDNDGHIIWGNKRFLSLHDIMTVENKNLTNTIFHDNVKRGQYVLKKAGEEQFFEFKKSSIKLEGNSFYVISLFDVSKSQNRQVKLLSRMNIFKQLCEYLPEGILLFDEKTIYTNPRFEKLVGYTGMELLTKSFEDLIEEADTEIFNDAIQKLTTFGKSRVEYELRLVTKKQKTVWVRVKTSLLLHEDNNVFYNIVTNITDERLKIEKLNQLAFYDALTGIYNRRKFNELLEYEYNRAKRYDRPLCGIFFDIDHFKKINDTYGHDVGDEVLQGLSHCVQGDVRETDFFARWGGEEFILLLPETESDEAVIMAEHIRKTIAEHDFAKVGKITISIGISMIKGKERLSSFVKRLDKALYMAKTKGRNRTIKL